MRPRVEVAWREGEDEIRESRDRNSLGSGRTLLEVRIDNKVRRFRAPAHGPPIAIISRVVLPQADFDRLWYAYGEEEEEGEKEQGYVRLHGVDANAQLAELRFYRVQELEAEVEALTQKYEAEVRQLKAGRGKEEAP